MATAKKKAVTKRTTGGAVARTRTRAPAAPAAPPDMRNARYEMTYQDIASIRPYAFNPRNNEAAIESVANSIKLVGFIAPVVVDRNGVLVAGHTRVEAAKTLGLSEIPAIFADSLTEDQLNAFRLIDNKVSELARWDFDLLSGEIRKLENSGINFTDFGWNRAELDCLTDTVADDCLSAAALAGSEAADRQSRTERRAPNTARFVLGELVFFIPATEYRTWVDGLRGTHDYNEADIVADLKARLGLPPTR